MSSEDSCAWMWERARTLLERAERMHRQFFVPARGGERRAAWQAPVDVFETPRELHVFVALPGVAPEDVQITVDGSSLCVTGRRLLPPALREAVVSRIEIPHGAFESRIPLPGRRFEIGTCEFVHGCLALVLNKLG